MLRTNMSAKKPIINEYYEQLLMNLYSEARFKMIRTIIDQQFNKRLQSLKTYFASLIRKQKDT